MKRVITALNGNVKNTSINRLAIRRCVFEDYMDARKKEYFKQQGLLKIFYTERLAVDGGGLEWEFFKGILL